MTMFEMTIQLMSSLLPGISVLAFLLFHRRQHIQAELQELRLRQEHTQLLRQHNAKHSEALSTAAQAFAPMLCSVVEAGLARLKAPASAPVTAAAADVPDHELVDELYRRATDQGWPGWSPSESCYAVDDDIFDPTSGPVTPPAPGPASAPLKAPNN